KAGHNKTRCCLSAVDPPRQTHPTFGPLALSIDIVVSLMHDAPASRAQQPGAQRKGIKQIPVRRAIGSQPRCAEGWPQQQIGSYRSVIAHQAQKGRSTLVNTRKVFGQPLSQGSTDGLLYTCQLFFYCIHCTAICSAITEIS